MCIWRQCNKDPSAALGMTILGERIGSQGRYRRFFRRWYPRIAAFQLPVIPLISGEWIVSLVWYEILRLSPHLFWLGFFTHRAFSSAQDDDT